MLMYADDTTLYCNLDQNSTSDSLNNELKFITNWLNANKISLNIGKTKHMIYHNIDKKVNYPVLMINNVEIERVTHFNIFRAVFDSQLNWKRHLDHISLKTSKIIGILHRLNKVCIPRNSLVNFVQYSYCTTFKILHIIMGFIIV